MIKFGEGVAKYGGNSNTVLGRRKYFHKAHDTSYRSMARGQGWGLRLSWTANWGTE